MITKKSLYAQALAHDTVLIKNEIAIQKKVYVQHSCPKCGDQMGESEVGALVECAHCHYEYKVQDRSLGVDVLIRREVAVSAFEGLDSIANTLDHEMKTLANGRAVVLVVNRDEFGNLNYLISHA